MKFVKNIQKHPVIYAICVFLFMLMPQIVEPWWSLFSNKPMIPTIAKRLGLMDMSNITISWFSWITIPLGLGMFCYIIYLSKKPKKEAIEDLQLKIEHNENCFYESQTFGEEDSFQCLFGDDDIVYGGYINSKNKYFKVCLVNVYNPTEKTIKNVEVKLTDIEPCPSNFNKGILPLNLIFKNDSTKPPMQKIDINPHDRKIVEVIKWHLHDKVGSCLSIQHSMVGVEAEFPMDDRTYKIKIEVSGEDVICKPRYFCFGMVSKDNVAKRLWMWPA